MKPTRSLLLATAFLTALSACGSSGSNRSSGAATQSDGPTPAEVDTYLEALLPEQCDVEKIETANFIDPVSKEGRVSVKFVQAVTAPGFRQPMTFDIQAAKSVDGWKLNSLAGAFIMEKLRAEGPPEIEKAEFLAKIGGNPVPLDSDQAVQFFEQQAQLQAKDPA
jgi:ABC-type glycerol-3-phosphate transport system substrate-binding protein